MRQVCLLLILTLVDYFLQRGKVPLQGGFDAIRNIMQAKHHLESLQWEAFT